MMTAALESADEMVSERATVPVHEIDSSCLVPERIAGFFPATGMGKQAKIFSEFQVSEIMEKILGVGLPGLTRLWQEICIP